MKQLFFIVLHISISLTINAQSSLSERIALKACKQLENIDNYNQLEDSIQNSITNAMAFVTNNASPDEMKTLGTVEGIRNTFKEVKEILPLYCYNVRRLMIEEKKKIFYNISDIPKANKHYEKGNELMQKKDINSSIKEYKLAIKSDKNFVYAIDNLALAYRVQGNYKKSIKYHQESLTIFQEGDFAVLNLAVVYFLTEDYENSLKYYDQFKFFYPYSPEGYFGCAKTLFYKAEYENSIDDILIAHLIYSENNSDLKKDSKELMDLIFSKLKERNKQDLIDKKLKEYSIDIEN